MVDSDCGFCDGAFSLFLVLKLAQIDGKLKMETLILSGVVMQAFLGAIVSFLVSISNQVINEIIFWLMGSLRCGDGHIVYYFTLSIDWFGDFVELCEIIEFVCT